MNPPRCNDLDYINFLLATPGVVSAKEAARVQPAQPNAPAHDAFTRLLHRLEPDPEALWQEARPFVAATGGLLVVDDSVLDKPYAKHIGLVGRFWSGTHRRIVQGINLVTLLWTDGDSLWPCDYRLVNPAVGKAVTKNDLFRELLTVAEGRGLKPGCVAFDSWYSGKDNLKAIRDKGWAFLTQVRCNRRVNLNRQGNRAIRELPIAASGTVVHLEGFGLIKAFRIVASNGHTEHWVTNDLEMNELTRQALAAQAWGIEEYHRGLKQHCGVEAAPVRHAQAQRNHIGCAIRAFLRLEYHRFTTGISWFQAKMDIVREALRRYLADPLLVLPQPSTA
jgi:DDE superfamily endonuclease